MLYTMKELLKVAKDNQFAVPAFNICSYDMLKAIMEEVERLNAPVILEIHPDEIAYLNDEFVAAVRAYAHKSKVPVVIHLDHGGKVSDVLRAIRNGYTSVMIDASLQSFDDNIKITKEVVALAHEVDVSVEAEIGTIGNNGSAEGGAANIIYTDPEQAKQFVEETNIDTLAIAIGTAHGLYPKDKTPKLNIELLKELNETIDLPFVLHGGSGNPDKEVSEAVRYGVAKVNLSSDLKSVFFDALREILNENPEMYEPNMIYPYANQKVQEVVKHKMTILNTIDQAKCYK
ncbi:ketose-bisphosphate aldolase [Enterococcus hirae]|uniref:Ketose-bisphosphate aldolase n=1 Tax=Enterococcus hirae TaxID=1354 RepID=A0AB37IDQ3_ENTHR|nr:ketose-bisphosphate aldolase [Enterococcus hirae]EMF0151073.1 ketose-bisphosphate aldolase [Enterococcus hirae]EMF0383351.1 ketose-bisphosphate aldolase [Enterococcus hirae]EMF0425292.1 ketose-bisphosphate aldolase [Enterococcus hirae]EMF0434867.1 ketose-bisphosphate aldolase [Enterococcus hirae]EMF0484943.1 ketose-bisphosphate aldolase [Enterococcus hirae]